MSRGTYAKDTAVPLDRSRDEIERTLERFGAHAFAYAREDTRHVIAFKIHVPGRVDGEPRAERHIRIEVPMPDSTDRAFTHSAHKNQWQQYALTPAQRSDRYQQAVRQRWRALALIVTAKLAAVEAQISTVEQEFLAHIVLPDGRTAGQYTLAAVDEAYTTGAVPALLPGPARDTATVGEAPMA